MSPDDKLNTIKTKIEDIYRHILLRPQIFCRPIEIESYVMALESILDCLDDSTARIDSYRAYLNEMQYGATRFESRFELNNSCVLTFLRFARNSPISSNLDDKFAREFNDHWAKFLEWRSKRNAE